MRGTGSGTVRRLSGAVVALLCVAAIAAPTATAASAPVPAAKWAAAVCAGFDRWQRALGARISTTQNVTDPATVKVTLTAYLDGVVRDTGGLLKRLKSAGVPNVKHGSQIAGALRGQFSKARMICAATRRRVGRLDVTKPTAFTSGVAAVEQRATDAFTTARAALTALGRRYPARALDVALRRAAACQALA